jgi:hypothetical protein
MNNPEKSGKKGTVILVGRGTTKERAHSQSNVPNPQALMVF